MPNEVDVVLFFNFFLTHIVVAQMKHNKNGHERQYDILKNIVLYEEQQF